MIGTVLVLGATGMTGRRLIPLLLARGVPVKAASRQPRESHIVFDWNRPETHAAALAGVEAVYLIAPELLEDPTAVTAPFLERAKAAGVARLVLLSSLGVEFPNEDGSSGRHKLERQVIQSGMQWTILRPSGFNQNFSEGFLLPGILQADIVATATGDGEAAFIDANDIAAVAAATLTEDGHDKATYVITGPQALSFAEAAAVISKAAGRTITHRNISSEEFAAILRGAGMPSDYAAVLVRNQEAIREGAGARVTDVVARVSGKAATPFADYVARAATTWARS